jgi:hypothetical protein
MEGRGMKIKYRKRKSTRAYPFPYNTGPTCDCEIGDLLIDDYGRLFRLRESSGWGKRMAGDLTPCEIKPPLSDMKAILENGEIYWINKEATND